MICPKHTVGKHASTLLSTAGIDGIVQIYYSDVCVTAEPLFRKPTLNKYAEHFVRRGGGAGDEREGDGGSETDRLNIVSRNALTASYNRNNPPQSL